MVDQATAPPAVKIWQVDLLPSKGQRDRAAEELAKEAQETGPVSYTHLTLPTIYSV